MKKRFLYTVFFTGLIFLFQSCLSTAKLSEYPKDAQTYDFSKIASSKKTDVDKKRNSKTNFEYYLKLEALADSSLIHAIVESLQEERYLIRYVDSQKGTILAERGLQANEWKSVMGVYFQRNDAEVEIYLRCKISQDITGGPKDDRSEKVAKRICGKLGECKQSYSVKTI
jgi:hypothetical protein